MKKQSGITLIALVITIIVLLILAGVSISAVIGENGIATKAREAAQKTEEAKKEEEEFLNEVEDYINDALSELNEYGFYFDTLYEATVLEDGNEIKIGVIFHEDGSFEEFTVYEFSNDNLILNGFSPKDTIDYENWDGITISNGGNTLTNSDGVNFECVSGTTHGIYIGEEYKGKLVETVENVVWELNATVIFNKDGTAIVKTEGTMDGVAAGNQEQTMNGEYEANGYSLRFGEELDAAFYASPDGNTIMMDGMILVKD